MLIRPGIGADSKKFECGPGTIHAGCPSSQAFVVGGWSSSNCLAATVSVWKAQGPVRRLSKLLNVTLLSRRIPRGSKYTAVPTNQTTYGAPTPTTT